MLEEPLVFRLGERVEVEEEYEHEFKAIRGGNPLNRVRKVAGQYITAFLNSVGGTIYFGIENDGTVSGLLLSRKNRDEARKFIDQKVQEIDPPVDPSLVKTEFFPVCAREQERDDLCVLRVSVARGSKPVYYERQGGKAWVRLSGSNHCLNASQINERLARYQQQQPVEIVDEKAEEKIKREWQAYLEKCLRDFDDRRWEEEIYLPLRSYEPSGEVSPTLWQRVKRFLDSESESILFIVGRPGAGKTVLLERWVYRLAEDALTNLEASGELRPELQVPLYVNLNGYAHDSSLSFTDHIAQESALSRYVLLDPLIRQKKWKEIFQELPVPLVICLDALDEMDSSTQTIWLRNLREVKRFLNTFAQPRLKVIVTCRMDVMPKKWSYPSESIVPLSRQEIEDYFIAHLKETAEEAIDFAFGETEEPQLFGQLRELLQLPLLLEAAIEYWKEPTLPVNASWEAEKEEVAWEPSLGRLVTHIFDTVFVWERDKSLARGWEFNAEDWKDKLSQVAYWAEGKTTRVSESKVLELFDKTRKQDSWGKHKRDLICLRNMGVLRSHPDGVSFFNGLTHMYFAAWKLKRVVEEDGEELPTASELQCHCSFWKPCIAILQDITYRDVSGLLQQVAVEREYDQK
jgi:Cdc6-like AAA superfamily ATPase